MKLFANICDYVFYNKNNQDYQNHLKQHPSFKKSIDFTNKYLDIYPYFKKFIETLYNHCKNHICDDYLLISKGDLIKSKEILRQIMMNDDDFMLHHYEDLDETIDCIDEVVEILVEKQVDNNVFYIIDVEGLKYTNNPNYMLEHYIREFDINDFIYGLHLYLNKSPKNIVDKNNESKENDVESSQWNQNIIEMYDVVKKYDVDLLTKDFLISKTNDFANIFIQYFLIRDEN